MAVKKKYIFILIVITLMFCFTAISLFGYLHLKYPLFEWTNVEITSEGAIIFSILHCFFVIWILERYYPNKFLPQSIQGVFYTIAIFGSISVLVLLVDALFYGAVSIKAVNELAQNINLLFTLVTINLCLIAVLLLMMIITSFKLKKSITKEYSKSIIKTLESFSG